MAVRSVLKETVSFKSSDLRGASIGPTPKYLAKLYAPSSDGSECRIHFFKNPSDPEPRVVCTVASGVEFDIQRKKCAVRITMPSHWYECGFSSEQVMVSWVGKIKELQPGLVLKGDTAVLESMIYDSIPDPQNDRGPFSLELQRTSLLPYSGPVKMKVEVFPEQGMFLLDLFYESRGRLQPLVRWQIDHLRGYGASNSVLKIETGRKTPTGPGIFVFKTPQAETIRLAIHHWARTITESRQNQQPSAAGPPRPPRGGENKGGYESLNMQTQSPPPLYMPLHSAQNGAAAVEGQGHSGVSQNPAYQELQFGGQQSSHYQALTTRTRETPPEPTARTGSTSGQEDPVPSGSQYMPISPQQMNESSYTSLKHNQ